MCALVNRVSRRLGLNLLAFDIAFRATPIDVHADLFGHTNAALTSYSDASVDVEASTGEEWNSQHHSLQEGQALSLRDREGW